MNITYSVTFVLTISNIHHRREEHGLVNVAVFDTTSTGPYIYEVYTTSDGTAERIVVKDNKGSIVVKESCL